MAKPCAHRQRGRDGSAAAARQTGDIAHDLNNLLLTIGLTLELIEEDRGKSDPSLAPIIASAKQATEEARGLVGRLLALSGQSSS
jgi:signal transduction histidine kinase